MDYERVYNLIVEKAKNRVTQDQYTERHHIQPRCRGGSNEKTNIVSLTFREHFICHWLLCKIYTDDYKLKAAFAKMLGTKDNKNVSSHMYAAVKRNLKDVHFPWLKGKEPWNKGKTGLQKAWNKGRPGPKVSESTKLRTSETLRAKNKKLRDAGIAHHNSGRATWNKGKPGLQEAWNKGKSPEKDPCQHCGMLVSKVNMKRWHGDKCKLWLPV